MARKVFLYIYSLSCRRNYVFRVVVDRRCLMSERTNPFGNVVFLLRSFFCPSSVKLDSFPCSSSKLFPNYFLVQSARHRQTEWQYHTLTHTHIQYIYTVVYVLLMHLNAQFITFFSSKIPDRPYQDLNKRGVCNELVLYLFIFWLVTLWAWEYEKGLFAICMFQGNLEQTYVNSILQSGWLYDWLEVLWLHNRITYILLQTWKNVCLRPISFVKPQTPSILRPHLFCIFHFRAELIWQNRINVRRNIPIFICFPVFASKHDWMLFQSRIHSNIKAVWDQTHSLQQKNIHISGYESTFPGNSKLISYLTFCGRHF